MPQYLDDNGNPIASAPKTYLDDSGNPIPVQSAAAPAPKVAAAPPQPSATRRFLSSAIAPVMGAVKAVIDARPTPEEQQQGLTSIYDYAMRPLERVVEAQTGQVDEAKDLAKQGRYSEAAGHALASVVPLLGPWVADAAQQFYGQLGKGDTAGAVGTAVGNMALAVAPGALHEAKVATAEHLGPATRSIAQRALNLGPKAVRDYAEKATDVYNKRKAGIEAKNTEKVQTAQEKHTGEVRDALEANRAEQLRLKQEYEQKVRDANENYKGDKAKAQQANDEAQREYNRKVGKSIQRNRQIEADQQNIRYKSGRTQVQGSQIISRVKQLDQRVRQQANAKYDAVREKVGDATEPGESLGAAARQALEKIAGSADKPKIFRDIIAKYPEAEPEFIEYQGAQIPKGSPLYDVLKEHGAVTSPAVGFADLQGYYSELGSELSRGNLPADVYQATKTLQASIGNLMQRMANKAGAGNELISARKFYHGYMDTFHEPTGPSGSGSPVAQALDAKDPARAVDAFAGDAGERGVAMLRRYDPELANLAQEAQRNAREKLPAPRVKKSIADIPAAKTKPVPQGANAPLPPVLPDAEHTPYVEPKLRPLPKTPAFTPEEFRSEKMKSKFKDWRTVTKWDLGILAQSAVAPFVFKEAVPFEIAALAGRYVVPRVLDTEAVRGWLSKPSLQDFQALEALPPESQEIVRSQLKAFLSQQKQPVPLSPVAAWFLRGSAAIGSQRKKPTSGQPAPRATQGQAPTGATQEAEPGLPSPQSFVHPTDAWANPQQ